MAIPMDLHTYLYVAQNYINRILIWKIEMKTIFKPIQIVEKTGYPNEWKTIKELTEK